MDERIRDLNVLMDQVFRGQIPAGVVWHYTKPRGLPDILKSRIIWAGDSYGMNDPRELLTGHDAVADALAAANFPDKLRERMTKLLAFYRQQMERSETFILSASIDDDSLHQWDAYAGRDGYSIGFHVEPGNINLLERYPFNPTPENSKDQTQFVSNWRNVIYDPAEQAGEAGAYVELVARMLDPVHFGADPNHLYNEYTVELLGAPGYAATVARLKRDDSAPENEVRITATTLDPDRFRSDNPWGRPKVDLTGWVSPTKFRPAGAYSSPEATLLPIVEIRTGPDADVTGLRELLDQHGYGHVRISTSQHPPS
ncbi:hypothetical protein [Nocardioides terrisoli]|uniref:hypothetical protein n=1 Tax=Nocardioides terrisoli TaxID=3388267 RepID=UPI00287B9AFE|nr:hypothetical protein [Nocardioides marmorisolisilvae]